jgi:hypothetical protein
VSDAAEFEDLQRQLTEASESRLFELVRAHLKELSPQAVHLVLCNPYVSSRVIEELLTERRLLSSYEVRRELAAHPHTPPPRSLNLVGTLFWRDLVRMGADSRVPPRLRRSADLRLADRLPGLGVGEKMAIARAAGPGVITRLRHDPNPRVISALLENPRLTEGLLIPLVASEATQPKVLEVILRDRKWSCRYGLRVAAARNRRTPVPVALELLPSLKKTDLAAVAANPRVAAAVRRRADLLRGASRT